MNRLGLSKEVFVLILIFCGSLSQCYKNDRLESAASPISPLPNEIKKYDDYLIHFLQSTTVLSYNPFEFRMLIPNGKLKEKRSTHDVRIYDNIFEVHVIILNEFVF